MRNERKPFFFQGKQQEFGNQNNFIRARVKYLTQEFQLWHKEITHASAEREATYSTTRVKRFTKTQTIFRWIMTWTTTLHENILWNSHPIQVNSLKWMKTIYFSMEREWFGTWYYAIPMEVVMVEIVVESVGSQSNGTTTISCTARTWKMTK